MALTLATTPSATAVRSRTGAGASASASQVSVAGSHTATSRPRATTTRPAVLGRDGAGVRRRRREGRGRHPAPGTGGGIEGGAIVERRSAVALRAGRLPAPDHDLRTGPRPWPRPRGLERRAGGRDVVDGRRRGRRDGGGLGERRRDDRRRGRGAVRGDLAAAPGDDHAGADGQDDDEAGTEGPTRHPAPVLGAAAGPRSPRPHPPESRAGVVLGAGGRIDPTPTSAGPGPWPRRGDGRPPPSTRSRRPPPPRGAGTRSGCSPRSPRPHP